MPSTPRASRALRTSSSLNGLITAMMYFMATAPRLLSCAAPGRRQAAAGGTLPRWPRLRHALAVQADVEAFALGLFLDPERHHRADDLQQHERHHAAVHQGHRHPLELGQELPRVALQEPHRGI